MRIRIRNQLLTRFLIPGSIANKRLGPGRVATIGPLPRKALEEFFSKKFGAVAIGTKNLGGKMQDAKTAEKLGLELIGVMKMFLFTKKR